MKKTYWFSNHTEISGDDYVSASGRMTVSFKNKGIEVKVSLTEDEAYSLIEKLASQVPSGYRAEQAFIRGRKAYHGEF